MERELTVQVWGQPYTITVYQKSKSVWVAVGVYMEKRVETKGATEGAAVKRWREAATYRGNG